MEKPTTATLRWIILLALGGVLPSPLPAGDDSGKASPDLSSALPVPFGPGEVLTYNVKLGIFPIGESTMQVSAIEPTRGIPTYRVEWRIKGGIPFYKVDTRFQSWIDIERLASLRFIQDQHEGSYTRFREFQFFPERALWKRVDNGEQGPLASPLPLDDLSFIYFARSLDLRVGKEYRFDRYFKESGNPVILKVLRRDQRVVPAGTFKTIVVQPIIRTKGLFSEGGKAELHLTDDARRILVYLKTEVPGISLTLHLKSIRPAHPGHGSKRSASVRNPNPRAQVVPRPARLTNLPGQLENGVLYSFYRTNIERHVRTPGQLEESPMTRPNPYFMHDQVRHRVRLIMGGSQRPAALTGSLWPLIAAVCALTVLNVMTAMPPL